MRKVFTFMFALCMTVIANAQFPDSSKWNPGQDISADLSWGDYSGTWSAGGAPDAQGNNQTPNASPYWQGTQPTELSIDATSDPTTNPYPAVAFYQDGAGSFLPDMYQVIPLPAGYYTFSFQATYREGTADDTWASFKAGNPKFNGRGYVNVLAGNSPDAEVISAYECPILTLPYSTIKEKLYINDDASKSWKSDGMYKWTGEAGADSCSYPCSSDGAATHFLAGNYKHSLKFILLEDGYIRLGIKKVAGISQDWLVWSNMQIWYEGPADEEAQRALADEHFQDAMGELATLQSRIEKEGYIALVSLLEDAMIELEGDYEGGTTEELNEGTQKAVEIRQQYEAAFVSAKSLGDLINMSEDMFVATDFPGKAEFEFAIEAAKEVAFADYLDDVAEYKDAFDGLSTSRAAYLDSQDFDADGNKDFTMLIKQPWFVNAQYNPEYLPVDGNESTKAWQLTEETWADRSALGAPGSYSGKVSGRTDIASDVVLSADVEATNQWFKRVNFDGWSPGLQLFYQSCLIGPSSGWNSINTGSEEICQQLVGLPEGYYSLKALMRGDAGGSWTTPDGVSTFHNIYAMNSAEDVVKSDFDVDTNEANNGWTQYKWQEWNPQAWKEHKTGIIQVPDGKLLIAAQTSNVMNATGFRLYFHGESPEFDKMIQPDIDAANAKYEALAFAGDKKYVKDLLDQIALPIGTDAALYEANMALIKEANKYMATVNDYMKNYKAVENFTALQGGYADGTDQFAILDVPFQYVLDLGSKDTETYVDAQAADKMYTAYAEYMPVYDKALKYKNDEIAKLIADQTAYLKANMADPALLSEYVAALSIPTNVEMIKQLGGETASEENPLDITSILKNPTFVDTSGWEGTSISQNEYARNNAEIWNQTTFDFYQSIPYMPAGKYKVTAQALYRDGEGSKDLAKCYQNWLDAGQDKNEWANHNAFVYVKAGGRTGKDFVTSVCDTKNTELSFADYFDFEGGDYAVGNKGKFLLYEELNPTDKAEVDAEGRENYGTVYNKEGEAFQYPFDGRVDIYNADSTEILQQLFFPESMAGAALRFQKDDYPCEAIVNALEEGTLQVGINKTAGVSGDWVIFTNFKLYYLGEPEDETTPEPNPSANLITDEPSYNFNDATVSVEEVWGNKQYHVGGWAMTWNNNDGQALVEVVAPGYNKSAQCLALSNPAEGKFEYSAQLEYSLGDNKLVKGKSYIAQFYAKADEGTTGEFQFSAEAGWEQGVNKYQFTFNNELTPTWKLYSVEFIVPEEAEGFVCEDLTAVKFNFGKLVGKAYVDRVLVYDATAEINPDGNLIVDDESFAFNGGTTGKWAFGYNAAGKATAVENGWNGSAYCMELAPNSGNKDNYNAQLAYALETPMQRGNTYKLSFYAKAENEGAEIEFGAQLTPWSASNKEWNGNMFALTTDWAAYEIEVKITDEYPVDGLNSLYINFGLTNGKAYVDHIVLVNAIEPEVNPEGNLIADDPSFGFEDGTTGKWYFGWNNGGTFVASAPGYGSDYCMALTANPGNPEEYTAQLNCPLKDGEAIQIGGEYEISFWAKTDTEGDHITPGAGAWPNPEWNNSKPAELTTNWQKFTYTLVADETNTAAAGSTNIYFNYGKLTGTAYVDRVTVICIKNPETAINGVEINKASSARYNLNGQVVGSDYKGIVIENGKKRLIK